MSRATVNLDDFPRTNALSEQHPFSDLRGALTEAVDSRVRLLRAGVEAVYEVFEMNLL